MHQLGAFFLDFLLIFFYLIFMKRTKLIPIIVSAFNAIFCLMLLIFAIPSQVPLLAGIHDEIVVIGSKWWLISGIVIPLGFMLAVILSKDKHVQLIFSELIIFLTYINMLAYLYFITATDFKLGAVSEVSISVVLFIPISLGCFIYGAILKNLPYKNKLGLVSKRTTTTEFIWNQAHFYGSYYYRLCGIILFAIAIIFSFVHYPLIELGLFIIGLIIPRIIVEFNAKQMTNKYNDMKHKHEHLINKNKAKPE